ncbi:hypothetical protein [Desulfovibrio sp. TomC]|uniref:hypothetical protein n=1 Tax=Desulfovibrio sp. TomC TaxID=1562888 RepID=UPI000574D5C3|nr:hypothetical protein [Desulfovibrio sp. TomC]KHK01001.1 hypothetical protein NY78_3542 [Desulfovibrio sp. TomC]
MPDTTFSDVATAIVDILERGLPQDDAVVHFIASTYGDLPDQALAALVADSDDPQAASLLELLLFPGPGTALALEDVLGQARLDAADLPALAQAVTARASRAVARMPSGSRIPLPLAPESVRRLIDRLSPHRSLPADLRARLETHWPDQARELAVVARQIGPDWTPAATAFTQTLLDKLAPATSDPAPAVEAVRFALRFLADQPAGSLPLPALFARRNQLAAQLRRAAQQEEALAKSNYETLILSGNRLPYLHAPDIARELGLADAVIVAMTGRPAPDGTASCQNLGVVAGLEELLSVFDRQTEKNDGESGGF